jgi:diacylglycerol kinase (ATP)
MGNVVNLNVRKVAAIHVAIKSATAGGGCATFSNISAQLRASGLTIATDDSPADLAVVAGGDGTIHRALPKLIHSAIPVLIFPCGSGNDFARALGITSVRASLRLARDFVQGRACIRELDLGIISDSNGNETPFCCVAGMGLDAAAAQFGNRLPPWLRAHGGYLLAALKALLSPATLSLRISAVLAGGSEREIEQDSCLFSMANAPFFGGGLPIAPGALLDDGQLDCVLVRSMSRFQLLRRAPLLLNGRHLRLKEVDWLRVQKLEIISNPPTEVFADGEPVCSTPVSVRVLRSALRVIAPG